jgi:threonine/homoserine/homoserine lactone efflux protein
MLITTLMLNFDLAGYLIFAFVTSITPGPNNYMLFWYGKTYGYKDSNKLMLGILCGFLVLLFVSGYGIASVVLKNKTIGLVLKVVSSCWLLYLAFALSKLSPDVAEQTNSKIGFVKGFFMQFINPKAWIMAITGAGAFMPGFSNVHINVLIFAFTFGLVGIPCMVSWVTFGDIIAKWLKSEKANKVMSISLFLLMVMSVVMIWI